MKISSNNNPRVFDQNDAVNQDVKNTPKQAEETNKADRKDRVEISGDAGVRTTAANRIGNAYMSSGPARAESTQPVLDVSPDTETSISAERQEQIRGRIEDGYYDSDQVMDDVAKMMVNDVKKIDHNM